MKSIKMQHAMHSAAILGAYMVATFYIRIYVPIPSLNLLMAIFVPFLVFLFQKKYRDETSQGKISYNEIFTYGVSLFFFASLILGLGQFIFYRFIDPHYLANAFNSAINTMQQLGIASETMLEEASRRRPEPITFVLQVILIKSFLGVVISAVTAIFVKKSSTNE